MGAIFLWTGLTMILAIPQVFPSFSSVTFFGGIVMLIGLVLLYLGR